MTTRPDLTWQAVLRVMYAYLTGVQRSRAPKLEIPLHTVIKLEYDGWNPIKETRYYLGPDPLANPETNVVDDGQKNL